jgi:hypothetical protein
LDIEDEKSSWILIPIFSFEGGEIESLNSITQYFSQTTVFLGNTDSTIKRYYVRLEQRYLRIATCSDCPPQEIEG